MGIYDWSAAKSERSPLSRAHRENSAQENISQMIHPAHFLPILLLKLQNPGRENRAAASSSFINHHQEFPISSWTARKGPGTFCSVAVV